MMALFLMLVFFVSATIPVHGQQGFVSIDCGYEGDSYSDATTNLTYVSDAKYIDTGKTYRVSVDYNQPRQTQYVRSFPDGDRNCYTLNNISQGVKYLIRGSFLYGNYDGEDSVTRDGSITFYLHLGVNFWRTVKILSSTELYVAEIVTVASDNYFSVCLVKNQKSGVPFISALELRPIDKNDNVFEDVTPSISLVFYERYNVGGSTGVVVRYPDDKYDRTWKTCYGSRSCSGLLMNTNSLVMEDNGDNYDVPSKVMQTAVNTSRYYLDEYHNGIGNPSYHIYVHFAELWNLNGTGNRSFMATLVGDTNGYDVSPTYLLASHLVLSKIASMGDSVYFDLTRLGGSTLPPILNAVEAYVAIKLPNLATDQGNVAAMMTIKNLYQIEKWQGDPCGPTNFTWVGVKCTITDSNPPSVLSLNLTSHGLTGGIPIVLANLTAIQELDLSSNSLTGTIPEFLANMSSLRLLNLSCNQLSGPIPAALLEKQKSGRLALSLDPLVSNNTDNKKKLWIILVASIVLGVAVLVLIGIWFRRRARRRQHPSCTDSPRRKRGGLSISSDIRRLSYLEVKAITNNFENAIGRGGFGIVYHGVLEDNTTEVAVKIRSDASAQGTKEFNAEANLSSKVQHTNLVSLVGYCEEDNHLTLIYPYMDNGSLTDHLFDKDGRHEVLSWERRLKIAIDAAQGLEYLHTGCAVPIIHRDVKTHNILLTKNFEAKMADFGMSKPFPIHLTQSFVTASRIVGTDGFLDPE